MVECKIKRPNLQSYTSVLDSKPLDGQLDILSDAVIQAYEAYNNYRYNKFKSPQYHYDGSKKASICVVTMEDWYIIGNIRLRLEELVKEKMRKKKIDESLLEGVPFIVMSISEFEEFSYYLKKYDAHELISKHCNDFHGYTVLAIRELISEEFLKCYKYIFQEQFRDCFTEELGSIVDMSDSFIRPPE